MWRALIGSIKHEEKKREGEQEVNQAAALSDLVIFRSYVTHKSEEMKENDKAGRRKEVACTQAKSCAVVYITHLPQRPGKLFFNTRHENGLSSLSDPVEVGIEWGNGK